MTATTTRVVAPGTAPQLGAQVFRLPPPLYYGAGFAAAMVVRNLTVPLDMGRGRAGVVAGAGTLGAGAALALAGVVAVVRRRTTIVPHRPVSILVTSGPYRLSRNPMYTGLAIAYVGGALLVGSWWPLATLPLALLLIRRVVIDPEERYLAGRFGEAYADYCRRCRRWL